MPLFIALGVLFAALVLLYFPGIQPMLWAWQTPEYSHGYLIPAVAAYLIWQRRPELEQCELSGAWIGVLLLAFGLFLNLVGELASIFTIIQYGFVFAILGGAWALIGTAAFRYVWPPLALLFFMVPLPQFLFQNLSAKLQLVSSAIGVWVIELFGISVFLQGNVIDLGAMQLQVVEACAGLRYLFPLVTLGAIVAYFFQAPWWKRLLVLVSTVPITVFMNSFRIGVIGVTVEYWGPEMAEGFLHDFEGWIVFMGCFGILFIEMLLLTKAMGDRRSFSEIFGLTLPLASDESRPVRNGYRLPAQAYPVLPLLIACGVAVIALPNRAEVVPERSELSTFPLRLGEWEGRTDRMEFRYLDALKLSDYVLNNYRREGDELPTNFYVAWYDSQRKGQSAHSPRSCIPGGGWRISSLTQGTVEGVSIAGKPLRYNRVEIALGDVRQVVYYWFQQRGRVITNEYLVKAYLFVDSLLRNRTDGALVRVATAVPPGASVADADARIQALIREVVPPLAEYVPD